MVAFPMNTIIYSNTIPGTRQRNNLVWDSMFRRGRGVADRQVVRPTLTLDNVPLLMPYMLSHATSNFEQGGRCTTIRPSSKH